MIVGVLPVQVVLALVLYKELVVLEYSRTMTPVYNMLPGGSISDKRRSWTRYCSSTYCSGTSWPPVSSIPSTTVYHRVHSSEESAFQYSVPVRSCFCCCWSPVYENRSQVCKSQSPVCISCYDLCFRLSEYDIYIHIIFLMNDSDRSEFDCSCSSIIIHTTYAAYINKTNRSRHKYYSIFIKRSFGQRHAFTVLRTSLFFSV